MNIGDIVIVFDTKSIPVTFLGLYGRIINIHDYKVTVEFYHPVNGFGGLSHTAFESDLKKIGEVNIDL